MKKSAITSVLLSGAALAWSVSSAGTERILQMPSLTSGKTHLTLGTEFPGAKGCLTFGTNTARIDYDLSHGGHYVGLVFSDRIDAGGCRLTADFRGEAPSAFTILLRVEDGKHDTHVQSARLNPSCEWTEIQFDLTRFSSAYGKSTNATERARLEWPLSKICLAVQPTAAKAKGSFEIRNLRLTTTLGEKELPGWTANVRTSRFGALYYPDEKVDLDYAIDFLEVERNGPPAIVPTQLRVTDWRDQPVYVCGITAFKGRMALSSDMLGRRFGSFKVVVLGQDADGCEREISRTWFARLTGPRPKTPIKWIGTGIHGWGADVRRYDLMVAAGIGAIRSDALWRECERKKGAYGEPSGHFVANIRALKERDIAINIALTHPNPIAYPRNPLDPDAHAAFCAWFAENHPDIDAFEIYNEGWSFGFKSKYGLAKWIGKLVEFNRKAAPLIHRVRPDAAVLVASEDSWGAISREIQLGVAAKGDVLSFHPYIHGKDPRPERCGFFWADDGAEMKACLAEHGGATRLRITEVGWTTYGVDENGESESWFVGGYPGVSYEAQARYIIRAYLIARSAGVETMFQYDFRDDGLRKNYTEHNFGLLFNDYTPKPSFAAVAFMARMLGEAEPLGEVGQDKSRFRILAFRLGDGRKVYALWAIEGTEKIVLPMDAVGGTVYDLMGNARSLDPSRTEVSLSENPHYILCR